jgi:NTE family protein
MTFGERFRRLGGLLAPLFMLLLLAPPLAAQTMPPSAMPSAAAPPAGKPRIGLVLGGGGAKGFAHIGVLQVLEENRIPVYLVAGTSMGSVVGSLYAAGNDAGRLQEIADDIDWNNIFQDNIPRDSKSFRRKQDQRNQLIDFRIAFDDNGIILPPGVLRGQDLFLTLSQKLGPARGVRDFDNLATPFRAVATDITTGQAVVMGSGDVATAAFASMAVPGGLPPVERDGLLLVDGGVVDNLPIDVARGMGAEVLIVVNVGDPLLARDEINSFVDVLNQLQLLLGFQNVQRQIKSLGPRDVLITPDIEGLTATSFNEATLGIERGRKAATAALPALIRYQLSVAEWEQFLATRKARSQTNLPVVRFVEVENQSDIPDKVVENSISISPGEPLDPAVISAELTSLFNTGLLRAARYEIVDREGEGEGIAIRLTGDPTAENFLQVGLTLSTDFNFENNFGFALAYTDRSLFGRNIEWRTDVAFGPIDVFNSSLYKEFGHVFVETGPFWIRRDTLFYLNGAPITALEAGRLGVRLDGGLLFSNWGELRFGLNWSGVNVDSALLPPDSQNRFGDNFWRVQFTADTLDNLEYPTDGFFGQVDFIDHVNAMGGDFDYTQVVGRAYWPISNGRSTLVLGGDFGATLSGATYLLGDFPLGGLFRLSGLAPNQLLGRQAFVARGIFYHRLTNRAPIINLPFYAGGSLEAGNVYESWSDLSAVGVRPAGSLFVSADTPFGPLTFAGGFTGGSTSLYLVLGRIF